MNKKTKKYEPAMAEWPDMVAYGRLQESYDYYRRRKGSSSSIPSYNAQQLKAAFESRGLLPHNSTTARVAHTYEEWQNGKVVEMTKYIRITQLPSKQKIEEFLHEHYGFNPIREGEDVTDQVEAGHTVLTRQPDF